jgi:hypothetical protein
MNEPLNLIIGPFPDFTETPIRGRMVKSEIIMTNPVTTATSVGVAPITEKLTLAASLESQLGEWGVHIVTWMPSSLYVG